MSLTSGPEFFNDASAFANISASPAGLTFDMGTSSLDALTKTLILEYNMGPSIVDIDITLNETTFGTILTGQQGVSATARDNLTGSFKSDGAIDVAEEIKGTASTPEPASIALLGGVALLVPVLYRRRQRSRT